jgi:hypothetical protein
MEQQVNVDVIFKEFWFGKIIFQCSCETIFFVEGKLFFTDLVECPKCGKLEIITMQKPELN